MEIRNQSELLFFVMFFHTLKKQTPKLYILTYIVLLQLNILSSKLKLHKT